MKNTFQLTSKRPCSKLIKVSNSEYSDLFSDTSTKIRSVDIPKNIMRTNNYSLDFKSITKEKIIGR